MTDSEMTPIVGIEIHVELATQSKMFCGCKNDPFGAEKPNIYTCPVCLGLPGALPVANKKAIKWAIKIGLALGCSVNLFSKFDRKHYFYPDLPKGYQISQYDLPFCINGEVKTQLGDVRITRVHLEEDTGKLLHQVLPSGEKVSLIDFNRSSVPLVEIVSEPDIHSPQQAKAYAKKIHQIITYLGVSSADMEKGSMRLEANISVQTPQEREENRLPEYKVEVKNLNSFRYIEKAIAFEITRQTAIREQGQLPQQETRGWNEAKNETFSQRSKEDAKDYRYFPDPDLPPIRLTKDFVKQIKDSLPLLPDTAISHLVSDLGIKESDAQIISDEAGMVKLLDEVSNQIKSDPSLPTVAKITSMIVNKKVAWEYTKDTDLVTQAQSLIQEVVKVSSVEQVGDEEISKIAKIVIANNPKAVTDYKSGKEQVMGFLIGMVNKQLGKKVSIDQVRKVLITCLQS